MKSEEFKELALSFPGTESAPHFDRLAFRIVKGKIFASLLEKSDSANLKLSKEDQKVFSEYEGKQIFPVPNKFGDQGWTTFELSELPEGLMLDALNAAYLNCKK